MRKIAAILWMLTLCLAAAAQKHHHTLTGDICTVIADLEAPHAAADEAPCSAHCPQGGAAEACDACQVALGVSVKGAVAPLLPGNFPVALMAVCAAAGAAPAAEPEALRVWPERAEGGEPLRGRARALTRRGPPENVC